MTRQLPTETPAALISACKCEEIDPHWPIQSPLHALKLLLEWDTTVGAENTQLADHIYRITHSHAHEDQDRKRLGIERLYDESIYIKYVSIAWHLAGRYEYDNELIKELESKFWPPLALLDFGAAPWIQSIFYANQGLDVTAINKSVTSDTNRFGKWLADKDAARHRPIKNFASADPVWGDLRYDIVYAVDVLEHIPPLSDGTPGWIPYAEKLWNCLKPGGIWYINAPLDYDPGTPRPVAHHPVHYTSPLSVEAWAAERGAVKEGHFLSRKPVGG